MDHGGTTWNNSFSRVKLDKRNLSQHLFVGNFGKFQIEICASCSQAAHTKNKRKKEGKKEKEKERTKERKRKRESLIEVGVRKLER